MGELWLTGYEAISTAMLGLQYLFSHLLVDQHINVQLKDSSSYNTVLRCTRNTHLCVRMVQKCLICLLPLTT